MKVVGLCGGSGSGKSAVSSYLSSLNIPVIDTDKVYHELTSYASPCLLELASVFGDEIVSDGRLDRRMLANIIFSSDNQAEKLELLNSVTHKHILDRTKELLADLRVANEKIAFIEVPLLFESGFNNICDYTVALIADTSIRINRIVERDNISEDEAKKRIAAQMSSSELISLSDYVVYNNGQLSDLYSQVDNILDKILKEI